MLKIQVKKQYQNGETQKAIENILISAGEILVTHQFDKRPIFFVSLFLGKEREETLKQLLTPLKNQGVLELI